MILRQARSSQSLLNHNSAKHTRWRIPNLFRPIGSTSSSPNRLRRFSTSPTHNSQRDALRLVPKTTPFVPDVPTFLTLIGRKLSQHASKITDWPSLFRLSSTQLRELGIEPARDRRYLLRWREKFRNGDFGIGGDATHVGPEGRVELRAVEVQRGSEVERRVRERQFGKERVERFMREHAEKRGVATVNKDAGVTRVVLNVPWTGVVDAAAAAEPGEPSETKEEVTEAPEAAETSEEGVRQKQVIQPLSQSEIQRAAPIMGFRYKPARGLGGPHIKFIKGSRCEAAVLAVQEGLWEHKRGHKVDGGERRKAEVRFKRKQAEARAART